MKGGRKDRKRKGGGGKAQLLLSQTHTVCLYWRRTCSYRRAITNHSGSPTSGVVTCGQEWVVGYPTCVPHYGSCGLQLQRFDVWGLGCVFQLQIEWVCKGGQFTLPNYPTKMIFGIFFCFFCICDLVAYCTVNLWRTDRQTYRQTGDRVGKLTIACWAWQFAIVLHCKWKWWKIPPLLVVQYFHLDGGNFPPPIWWWKNPPWVIPP